MQDYIFFSIPEAFAVCFVCFVCEAIFNDLTHKPAMSLIALKNLVISGFVYHATEAIFHKVTHLLREYRNSKKAL